MTCAVIVLTHSSLQERPGSGTTEPFKPEEASSHHCRHPRQMGRLKRDRPAAVDKGGPPARTA
jgi:hypothetical protein